MPTFGILLSPKCTGSTLLKLKRKEAVTVGTNTLDRSSHVRATPPSAHLQDCPILGSFLLPDSLLHQEVNIYHPSADQ